MKIIGLWGINTECLIGRYPMCNFNGYQQEVLRKELNELTKYTHLTEEVLKVAFVSVFSSLNDNKNAVIEFIRKTIAWMLDTKAIDKQIAAQELECSRADDRV